MKKDLILPSGFLILLLILIDMAVFLPVGADTLIGSAKFDPNGVDLALPAPSVVEATIRFENESVQDIDTSTMLLEGSLPPDNTYLVPGGLVAEFDGGIVVNLIIAKITHMGVVPPYKVWLTITGKLKDAAGGTPFSAEGYIKILVPHSLLSP